MKRMKLLTKELERRFAQLGSQEARGDEAVVVAKFFTPDAQWTWWATEYDPESREFFGLVRGFEVELGSFSLDELESATGPLGLPIERDLSWKEQTLGEVRRALDRRRCA